MLRQLSIRTVVRLVFVAACVGSCPSLAQQATIETLDPRMRINGLSADGNVVVGYAYAGQIGEGSTNSWSYRAMRQEGLSPALSLGTLGSATSGDYFPLDVSGDGSVVTGYYSGYPAADICFRWTLADGIRSLDIEGGGYASCISRNGSIAYGLTYGSGQYVLFRWTEGAGVSYFPQNYGLYVVECTPDGSVVVGNVILPEGQKAFRWSASGGTETLAGLPGFTASHYAQAVSANGEVIVGYAQANSGVMTPFRWTRAGGTEALQTPSGFAGAGFYDVSDNGRIIVGETRNPDGAAHACLWIDGQAKLLKDYLADEFDFDLDETDWTSLRYAYRISADGRTIVGYGTNNGSYSPYFRVRLPNSKPTLKGDVANGDVIEVPVGQTFRTKFVADDLNGDVVYLSASGDLNDLIFPGTLFQPLLGSGLATPSDTEFSWAPGENNFDASRTISVFANDMAGGTSENLTFTLVVPPNVPPTASAMAPQVVECIDGKHRVALQTKVDDVNRQALRVEWLVDGQVRKTESDVAPGSVVSFEYDYPHGVHQVTLKAFDGFATASVGTTVTVQDTTAPVLVVAPDVQVGTDPGKDFATNVTLTEPTVTDAAGHGFALSANAPSAYPLGETIVVWTATDEAGNAETATQKVVVVDDEAPTVAGTPIVRRYCDSGKLFSSAKLLPPTATDNVSSGLKVEGKPPARFPIGATEVVWTATDAAGNRTTWKQRIDVVNRKPKANAGKDVTIVTTSERGARVTLDGSRSSDRDRHALKYRWHVPRVRLARIWTAKPSGLFPVGASVATLTVIDGAKARSADTVRIVVKLKNARHRPHGAAANQSFARAERSAVASVSQETLCDSSASGLAYLSMATAYGDAVGEFVRWDEGQAESDALLDYALLRLTQQRFGAAAAESLMAAYAQSGDENLLEAATHSAWGSVRASHDLTE